MGALEIEADFSDRFGEAEFFPGRRSFAEQSFDIQMGCVDRTRDAVEFAILMQLMIFVIAP